MAGHGPPPKDPSKRVRRNADPSARKKYLRNVVEQPPLPTFYVFDEEGNRTRFVWPDATKRWWKTWGEEPLAQDFTATDWDFLLDTAQLHARLWRFGDTRVVAELRLRVAKLGATVEDRQRLRIEYTSVQDTDGGGGAPTERGARARRGPLTAVN